MNPRDELIRRALMHIRNGYAVGGKPGESAMSRAEAERGVSSGNYGGQTARAEAGSSGGGGNAAGTVGGIRDGGFGGTDMGQQRSNTVAKSDFGFAGQPSANLAAKGDFLTSSTNPLSNYVAPSPSIGEMAYNRALAESIHNINTGMFSMPNLTGTNVPAAAFYDTNINKPSTVNFGTALASYGGSLPISRPKTISDYMGSGTSAPPVNGPITQQVQTAAKGNFLGMPVDRISRSIAGQTNPLASYMGSPAFSKVPSTQMASAPSMPSIGAMKSAEYQAMANAIKGFTPEQTNQLAFGSAYSTPVPNEVAQMIAGLKAAASNPNLSDAQKAQMEADINTLKTMGGIAVAPGTMYAPNKKEYGLTIDPVTKEIVKSPDYNVVAGPYKSLDTSYGTFPNISFAMPKSVALTKPGVAPNPNYNPMAGIMTAAAPAPQNILGSSYNMASNAPVDLTGLNANPPLEANRYLREPQNIVGSNYNVADSSMPVDLTGLNANPPLEANRYLREPQSIVGSNYNVADSGMPVDLTGLNANPPLEAQRYLREPQNILSSNYQYDGTPANAAYKAPASPQYAYDGTPANAVYKAPFSPQVAQYDRPPADASYTAGVAPPVQTAQTTAPSPIAKAPQVTQNIVANKLADAFRYRDDRDVGANRERNTTRKLLGLGYTQEQIAAMTPEEIREIIRGNTPPTATTPAATAPVVAANGGRIYKRDGGGNGGGTSRQSGDEESGGRSGKKSDNTPYAPISLPPMPQYQPYTLPQYTMPSASPLVSNFVGSLSQPIPPVQMPQYQSMLSPLQNVAPSFANPAMGTSSSGPSSGAGFGFGVNALRYNPMLMDERPDYALTTNDSLANALRLLKG